VGVSADGVRRRLASRTDQSIERDPLRQRLGKPVADRLLDVLRLQRIESAAALGFYPLGEEFVSHMLPCSERRTTIAYSCVSQLRAAAGSITESGGSGYPSGSRVTRASQPLASAAAAQTASSKSGQASASARRTTLSSTGATAKTLMRRSTPSRANAASRALSRRKKIVVTPWAGTMPWPCPRSIAAHSAAATLASGGRSRMTSRKTFRSSRRRFTGTSG